MPSKNSTRQATSYIVLSVLFPRVVRLVCCACSGQAARGGLDVEGVYWHDRCHREACR